MRVLYVTNAEMGRPDAPASRAKGLAAALARRGLQVLLLGTAPAPQDPIPGVAVECLPRSRTPRLGALAWHERLALRLAALRDDPFDVVLMRESPFTPEPSVFARLRGIPLVLEVNGVTTGPGQPRRPIARAFYAINYRAAARIVVLTEELALYLSREFGVPPARTKVIGNAADTSRFFPRDRLECRQRLGLPENIFCVLYMGSYHPQQGTGCVVPLCEALRRKIPGLLFVLTGDGEGRDALRREVNGRGLDPWFRFVGALPDAELGACVSAADVAFSPISPADAWRTEATFPQKIVEYLACGVPVLAMGYSKAQKRILEDEGCGRLVDPGPGHVDRLANTLSAWHGDPGHREGLGTRGVELARARFSYDVIASHFETLFRSL